MPAIITINDNNLLIQQQDSVATTQGYAWLLDGEVVFDFDDQNRALRSCRLQPQQIQNRYWQQCGQTSIATNSSGIRNSADLIWQHLTAIRNNFNLEQVIFVVPSHYQQDNLQLLLGIANSSGLSPQALVNKAVLVTQQHAQQDGQYLHIDLQLHQTVCSTVLVSDGLAKLSDIDIINDVSIQHIQDALLREMQQSFIQNNRFDPLHYAETEQQLFDQLPIVAKDIALQGKASIAVNHDTQVHSVAIDSTQWNSVLEPFAEQILAQGGPTGSTHKLMQLNKLFDGIVPPAFNRRDVSIIEDRLQIQSAQLDQDSDHDDGLMYRMELPLLPARKLETKNSQARKTQNEQATISDSLSSNTANVTVVKQAVEQVTHLMQAGLAVPLEHALVNISEGQLQLSRANASNLAAMLDKQQLFILNDSDRSSLKLNDRLGSNHADGVINAIQVLE